MIGLEYIRKLHSDTTELLSVKLNISKSIISQWENGKKAIPQKRLEEISEIYNVPTEWISKDLTRIDKLMLFKMHLTKDLKDIPDKHTVIYEDNDGTEVSRVVVDGNHATQMIIDNVANTILVENIVKDIYELVNIEYIDYDSPFDIMISTMKPDEISIYLLDMFISLMRKEPWLLLASILNAVKQSNKSEIDVESNDPLVDELITVIRKWKIREEEKKQAEEKKLNNLLGIDCE